jgi:hypothetical protein
MRWSERQKIVEQYSEDYIDELADELNISVPFYPQVWWIGQPVKFEDLGLSEAYRETFNDARKYGQSQYLHKQKTIIVSKYQRHHIAEEATHFLHFNTSRISGADNTHLAFIIEMIGFLGSKLLCPDRKNPYRSEDDVLVLPREKYIQTLSDYPELVIHQQGYGLGERLYYSYLQGNFSKRQIHDLFLTNFSPSEAKNYFAELRAKFWPVAA